MRIFQKKRILFAKASPGRPKVYYGNQKFIMTEGRVGDRIRGGDMELKGWRGQQEAPIFFYTWIGIYI